MEAVKTNIDGAMNIVDAALDCGVKRVVALSTDKAVNPTNINRQLVALHSTVGRPKAEVLAERLRDINRHSNST